MTLLGPKDQRLPLGGLLYTQYSEIPVALGPSCHVTGTDVHSRVSKKSDAVNSCSPSGAIVTS